MMGDDADELSPEELAAGAIQTWAAMLALYLVIHHPDVVAQVIQRVEVKEG